MSGAVERSGNGSGGTGAGAGDRLPGEVEEFLTHLVVEKGRSPLTLSAYRHDLRRYVAFLDDRGRTVHDATPVDVEAFVVDLRDSGRAASSTARTLVSVRTMHRFLAAEGLAATDPAHEAAAPRRPAALPKALSEAQVGALLDAVDAAACADAGAVTGSAREHALVLRDRALLEVLYSTGARVSEACGLSFGDLDLDAGFLRVLGKRSKERVVPIGRPAIRALAEYLDTGRPVLLPARAVPREDADAVLLGARGRRLGRQAAWEAIQRWARQAGLDARISPHVLRHSCATHLLDHGADIRTVQELLGHASVGTTQIYTRVATDRLFDAYRAAHPRAQLADGAGVRS